MSERIKLMSEYLGGDYSVAELARRHGVSRKSVYKWMERYERQSWAGIEERSRSPHRQARALSEALEARILAFKARWPNWGAPKIRQKLLGQIGAAHCPAESTVSAVLKRHGLVKAPRRRGRAVPGGAGPLAHCGGPNAVWCADFNGWWKTRDVRRCEPLTVSDAWSRCLLKCAGLREGTGAELVMPHFELLFREHGLPEAMRTDNGAPFASTGLGGLSALSVWWLKRRTGGTSGCTWRSNKARSAAPRPTCSGSRRRWRNSGTNTTRSAHTKHSGSVRPRPSASRVRAPATDDCPRGVPTRANGKCAASAPAGG